MRFLVFALFLLTCSFAWATPDDVRVSMRFQGIAKQPSEADARLRFRGVAAPAQSASVRMRFNGMAALPRDPRERLRFQGIAKPARDVSVRMRFAGVAASPRDATVKLRFNGVARAAGDEAVRMTFRGVAALPEDQRVAVTFAGVAKLPLDQEVQIAFRGVAAPVEDTAVALRFAGVAAVPEDTRATMTFAGMGKRPLDVRAALRFQGLARPFLCGSDNLYAPLKHEVELGDLRYTWYAEPLSDQDAAARCERFGGRLASIPSFQLCKDLRRVVDNCADEGCWIGLTASGGGQWLNGETFEMKHLPGVELAKCPAQGTGQVSRGGKIGFGSPGVGCGTPAAQGFICEARTTLRATEWQASELGTLLMKVEGDKATITSDDGAFDAAMTRGESGWAGSWFSSKPFGEHCDVQSNGASYWGSLRASSQRLPSSSFFDLRIGFCGDVADGRIWMNPR